MKLMVLIALTAILVSCGKNNTSGKGSFQDEVIVPQVETLQAEEESLRREFINQGQSLLALHQQRLRQVVGNDILQRMKNALRTGNISFTREELLNSNRRLERSQRTYNGGRVLYIGDKRPEMSWAETLYRRDKNLDKLLMHEMLEMGDVDDRGLQYTNRIL